MSEYDLNDPWARRPAGSSSNNENQNKTSSTQYNQPPSSSPLGWSSSSSVHRHESYPLPSFPQPPSSGFHQSMMHPPFGYPEPSLRDFPSFGSHSFPLDQTDLSLSMNGLHLDNTSPWGTTDLIEDMNQRMASLYQRHGTEDHHPRPLASSLYQHRGTEDHHSQPLASSGSALLSLLRHQDHPPLVDQPPTQPPTVDPMMTESLLGLLNCNRPDSRSSGFTPSRKQPVEIKPISRGISTAIVTPDNTKPNETIKVQVSLHTEERQVGRVLLLGLFRIGQPTNEKPIFVKQVLFDNKINQQNNLRQQNNQRQHWNTRITFRAPRSPGEFEFRIFEELPSNFFDDTSSIYSNTIIVRSNRLKVAMDYAHFIESLRGMHEKFRQNISKGDTGGILSNLLAFMRLIDQIETVFVHGQTLLEDFITELIVLVSQPFERITAQFSPTDSIPQPMETFHGTIRNVLNTIQANKCIQEFISCESWNQLEYFQQKRYCAISGLYFQSDNERSDYWYQQYQFSPISLDLHHQLLQSKWIDQKLTRWLTSFITTHLLPDSIQFQQQRQRIYDIINSHIIQSLDVSSLSCDPFSLDLQVFGSSANGFGTCTSDMDLCLVLPSSIMSTSDIKRSLLLQIVARFERFPDLFQDIDTSRLTARIPILMFNTMDPLTQQSIACDLSIDNQLALRNTKLVHTYANIDSRVRQGGYLLKYYVSQRQMNCAAEGTLSTYGYLLMWIYYLQQVHLVPILQTLMPSTRSGTRIDNSSTTLETNLPTKLTNRIHPQTGEIETIETYFYEPTSDDTMLSTFAHQNTMSIGQLWIGFLYYYAQEFNASTEIVSIRKKEKVSKVEKKQLNQWKVHARLSIEDPFEWEYDVAHVLKGTRDKYIRQQWMRAYCLIAQAAIKEEEEEEEEELDRVMKMVLERVIESPFS